MFGMGRPDKGEQVRRPAQAYILIHSFRGLKLEYGQIDLGKFNLNNIQEIALYNAQPEELAMPARSFAASSILALKTIRPELPADKPFKIMAGVKGGSFGLFNPYLQWQQRISNNWAFVLNGSVQKANGRYKFKVDNDGSDTLAVRKNSDVNAHQIDGGIYRTKSDSDRLSIQFNYFNSERGLPGPFIFYKGNSSQRLRNEDVFIQAGYNRIFTGGLHLLLNTKVSQNYQNYRDPVFPNNKGGLNEHYTQREFYQAATVAYYVLPQWEVSYSADIAIADLKSDIFEYAFPTRYMLLNVFATSYTLGRLTLQGNILNTYINQKVKTGTAPASRTVYSPTIIAAVKPFEALNLQVRAFYKNTFRNPTFSEEYYYAINPRSVDPEYVDEYNLGTTYIKTFDKVLRSISITADAYFNRVKNKIIYVPGNRSPDVPSVINLGRVDIKGADVNIKLQFESADIKYMLSTAYTYQDAVDVTDPSSPVYLSQIAYTPRHLISANAGISKNRVSVYYNLLASSSRSYSGGNTAADHMPAYAISDASLVYKFEAGKIPVTASAEVNNLFNKNYAIINSFPMPGTSVRFALQITI
jgi:vitamin B12 transporter